ncbi:GNAT family N-acetyltransferase [Psychrobacillus sp. FSL W7-1493]|uniref:GNAT family N-acetyltransferase n=1 Tax=unclassified Psychrobacillus TaxID=2636677 RepID=UPI004046D7E7
MEVWDTFNHYREKTGKTHIRGEEMEEGVFHEVVHVWIMNDEGQLLIQKRQAWKTGWPNMWDCAAAGSVLTGETSEMAAVRETKEELGIDINMEQAEVLFTVKFLRGFDDNYLIKQNVEKEDLKLQYEEVADAKWATIQEIKEMVKRGEFIAYHILDNVFDIIASKISLRKATIEDAQVLYEIQKQVFLPLYKKYEDHQTTPVLQTFERFQERLHQGIFYKIIVEDELAGSVHVYKKSSQTMRLHMINILESFQGKGLAQQVMTRLEMIYPEVTSWELDTILQEEKNCYLYEKMGYVRTGEQKKINDNMTIISYEKHIGLSQLQPL